MANNPHTQSLDISRSPFATCDIACQCPSWSILDARLALVRSRLCTDADSQKWQSASFRTLFRQQPIQGEHCIDDLCHGSIPPGRRSKSCNHMVLQYAWSSKLEISILGRALQKNKKEKELEHRENSDENSMRTRCINTIKSYELVLPRIGMHNKTKKNLVTFYQKMRTTRIRTLLQARA